MGEGKLSVYGGNLPDSLGAGFVRQADWLTGELVALFYLAGNWSYPVWQRVEKPGSGRPGKNAQMQGLRNLEEWGGLLSAAQRRQMTKRQQMGVLY